jgi:NADH dehydrogenase FAD-containing subunit
VQIAIAGGGITAFEVAANVEQVVRRHSGRADIVVYVGGTEPLRQLPRPAVRAVMPDFAERSILVRSSTRVERIPICAAFVRMIRNSGTEIEEIWNVTRP